MAGLALRRAAILLALLPTLATGCGDSRTPVLGFGAPAPPNGFKLVHYPAAGISFLAPKGWKTQPQRAPLVTVVASGPAVVSVWRFARSQPLPSTQAAVAHAGAALIRAAHARDATLQLIRSRALTLGGAPAVEVDAYEHIGNQLRRVRSIHLFAFGAEIVLDEYAPPSVFHAVDHAVFSPLKRSLRLAPSQA